MPVNKKTTSHAIAEVAEDANLSKIENLKKANLIGNDFEHGLKEADQNLDTILTQICHKAWEKEVMKKRQKPHCVEWMFASNLTTVGYNMRPDNDNIGTAFDGDAEDEPQAGRIDWG